MCRMCADQLVQKQRRELDPGVAPTAATKTPAGQRQLHPSIMERVELMVSPFPLTYMNTRL